MTYTIATNSTQTEINTTAIQTQTEIKSYAEIAIQTDFHPSTLYLLCDKDHVEDTPEKLSVTFKGESQNESATDSSEAGHSVTTNFVLNRKLIFVQPDEEDAQTEDEDDLNDFNTDSQCLIPEDPLENYKYDPLDIFDDLDDRQADDSMPLLTPDENFDILQDDCILQDNCTLQDTDIFQDNIALENSRTLQDYCTFQDDCTFQDYCTFQDNNCTLQDNGTMQDNSTLLDTRPLSFLIIRSVIGPEKKVNETPNTSPETNSEAKAQNWSKPDVKSVKQPRKRSKSKPAKTNSYNKSKTKKKCKRKTSTEVLSDNTDVVTKSVEKSSKRKTSTEVLSDNTECMTKSAEKSSNRKVCTEVLSDNTDDVTKSVKETSTRKVCTEVLRDNTEGTTISAEKSSNKKVCTEVLSDNTEDVTKSVKETITRKVCTEDLSDNTEDVAKSVEISSKRKICTEILSDNTEDVTKPVKKSIKRKVCTEVLSENTEDVTKPVKKSNKRKVCTEILSENTEDVPKKKTKKASKATVIVEHPAQYYIDKAANEFKQKASERLEEAIRDIQQQWRAHERNFRTHGITKKKLAAEKVTKANEKEFAERVRLSYGHRFAKELKFLALNLYYSNPCAYVALRKQLSLPVEKTLRRIDVGVSTKLTSTVLKCLKLMVSRLNVDERFCVVCADFLPVTTNVHKLTRTGRIVGYHEVDEIQSEDPATQILVVLVRSVISEWKQPLVSCYLKENFDYMEVISWIDNIISKVTETGLKVLALTTKPDRHFTTMATMRNVNFDNPYFYVGERKIYHIFDVPSVLVSFRDLLMEYNIEYVCEDMQYQASWSDIEKLYASDINRCYKLAPKIQEHHIKPQELDKFRVDLAAQVFSNSVASALNQCIELKTLTQSSLGTVKLVELLNRVFDILNSSTERNINKYKQAFSLKPYQKEALETLLNVLPTLKVTDKHNQDITSGVEEIKCMEIAIHSILSVAADLQRKGYPMVFTRNLSLECLHDYTLYVKRTWGHNKTTPIYFRGSFRTFYLQHVIKKSENNSSCGLDKELISVLMKE